jgi:hypothetical protein
MKKILAFALTLLLAIVPAVFAQAAENQYYLVEGYVTPGGKGEITRVELVDDVAAVSVTPGTEYAISACDSGGAVTGNTAFGVSFETAPDLPAARLDEARFAVLVPYNEEIGELMLVDRQDRTLSSRGLLAREGEASLDVRETEAGYELAWNDNSADPSLLDFDVYAVSEITGEKNVLAYRMAEMELSVPYDWLEPDDTIIFVLKSNDGRSTLSAESEGFNTPPGEPKDILDDEAWEGEWSNEAEEDDLEWYWWLIVIFLFVLLPAGLVVLIVVLVKKRKKRKLSK